MRGSGGVWRRTLGLVSVFATAAAAPAVALDYEPPGQLVPDSGTGRADDTVYAPDMRFPLEAIPAYANSQVYGHGGNFGPGGGQCDAENYAFPWRDNFCESRSYETPLCPTGNGHQGQDIRPSTCANDTWWAVAAEDGEITGVGSYSVILTADSGTQYRYLHMSMDRLAVGLGDRVARGDRMGLVSNDFGDTATTIHLHLEVLQYVASVGTITHVPPYASLVQAYEELEGVEPEPCAAIGPDGGIVDDGDRTCVALYGPAQYWRSVAGYGVGGGLAWTHAFDGTAPSNWARWRTGFERAGRYRVEVSDGSGWTADNGFDRSRELTYRVRHAGTETDVLVDQNDGADGWLVIGTFDFAAGDDQWVSVFDDTGEDGALERKIVVDAVRVTPVDEADPCASVDSTWRATGPCVVAATAPCAEDGIVTEVRDVCGTGGISQQTRQSACAIPSDGTVVEDWSDWGPCEEVSGGGIQSRERRTCSDGSPVTETDTRSCATDDDDPGSPPRGSPVARTRSGCSSAPGRPGGGSLAWLVIAAAVFTTRRRE